MCPKKLLPVNNLFLKITALIAVSLLASCSEKEADSIESPRTVLTSVVGASSGDVKSQFAGELRSIDRASLSFEVGGVVTDIKVELGDSFNEGDVLGRVDQTQATLALDARKAELLDAQASRQEARLEYNRRSNLRGTGAVSVASIEQAESRLESAQARLSAARSAVASAEKQLSDTELLAPFSGEVVNRLAEPSQVVNPGQPVLEVVGVDAGLEGIAAVPDYVRQAVSIGDSVQARVLSLGLVLDARITEIGSRANTAGIFPIILSIEGSTDNASSGQSIEVAFIQTNSKEGNWTIPLSAYTVDPDGQAFAFVVDATSLGDPTPARRKPVRIGELSSAGAQVIEGLQLGDVIITKGVDLLNEGQLVIPVDQNSQRFGG